MDNSGRRDASRRRNIALAVCGMHHYLITTLAIDYPYPAPPPRRKRRVWVWPYLQKRLQYGHYDTLMDELCAIYDADRAIGMTSTQAP